MLLDGRRGSVTAEPLYIGSDLDRLDFIKSTNPIRLASAEKLDRRASVGRARIRIADIDGEEFEEARARPLPRPGAECRQTTLPSRRVSNEDQIAHAGRYIPRPKYLEITSLRYV
jgi:hypothetical protein